MTLPLFDTQSGGNSSWDHFPTTALHTLGDVTLFLSIWIADCTMSWRMWIIWSKEWKVLIFPAVALTTGLVGAGFIITYDCIGIVDHAASYETWSETMIAVTAILNVYLTSMTCGKLWWVSRKVRKICPASQTSGRYTAFIGAVVEAGAVYTTSAVIFTILLHVSVSRLIFPYLIALSDIFLFSWTVATSSRAFSLMLRSSPPLSSSSYVPFPISPIQCLIVFLS